MVMDDLERAVVISFDESGAISALLKSQAITYCQQIKETPTICKVCIDKLWFSSVAQVQFWCLQTLHEVIRDRYGSLSLEEKDLVRKSLFNMCCYNTIDDGNAVKVLDGPVFIKNKLAQVLVTLISFEYPLIWSSVFVDLLPHLSKGSVVIDMFSRVLNALDDELISLDYPRTNEEIRVAGRVKDAMREQCVAQIVAAWYSIVYMYRNSDQEICSSVLDTLRRYVSWIDIGLIVNNAFILFLFELILFDGGSEQLRGAAAGCVLAIVSKKMDFRFKLTILKNLQINRVFGLLNEDNDLEFVSKVAELITGYATEVLECYKRLEIGNEKQAALELLKDVLPSVFYLMLNCKVDTTFDIVHFFSAYVSTMKSLSALGETQLLHVHQILEVIHLKILYDPTYRDNLDILDKIGKEEEDRMVEFRKDLFVLLRSVGRIAPQVTQMFIRTSLANAVAATSERNVEEVEAALSLFYALGESLSDEAVRNGGFQLGELVPMLLSARFACHSNRLVALVYLETISRHMKFVHENSQIIPMVLDVFLDDRGVYHPNIHVRRRASYLFMRLVKLLKAKLVPFIQMILQKLANAVAQFTRLDYASNEFSATDDGSHIFEALGLLIGMDEIPLEKQSDYLYSLLSPLCLQVKEGLKNGSVLSFEMSSAKITNLLQIILAINALSKGFSHRLVNSRPAIGDMFKQTLEALIQILIVYPKIETLRTKVTSYIHRMIDTLGESVFPYLPKALEQLLADTEPKEMVGFLILLNQLICKFNASFHEILVEVFPATVGRIFNVIPRDGFPSGPATNTEEIRELQELQKTLHIFLHAISTHDLSSVFLSPKSIVYFDQIMDMLLRSVCKHKDILVRKACVQIFTRLIKDWCAVPYVQEKVPHFQSYIMEFATSCCFYSVLDNSFDFHDANTCILLGEIVLVQKLMYEKYGDAFLCHFVSNGFRSAHCPQDLVDQYCQNLQAGDIKAFRLFYQSLIESLRGKENGYR